MVQSKMDLISNATSSVINVQAGSECDVALGDLRCMACSPDQGLWFSVLPYETDVALCSCYCDKLFANCSTATMVSNSSMTVSTYYSSAEEFCYRILQSTFHVNSVNTRQCFRDKRPCTADDYLGVYTPCISGLRKAYFYLKDGVECTGGVPLPSPVFNLPCSKQPFLLPLISFHFLKKKKTSLANLDSTSLQDR